MSSDYEADALNTKSHAGQLGHVRVTHSNQMQNLEIQVWFKFSSHLS